MKDRIKKLKEKVYRTNILLKQNNLITLTWGNVSEIDRELGVVAIKPSGVDYDTMTADDMVLTDLDGKIIFERIDPEFFHGSQEILMNTETGHAVFLVIDTALRFSRDDTAAQSVSGTGAVVPHVTDHGIEHVFIGTDLNDLTGSETVDDAFFTENTVFIVVDKREESGEKCFLSLPQF